VNVFKRWCYKLDYGTAVNHTDFTTVLRCRLRGLVDNRSLMRRSGMALTRP
jgi:hypothetical protein